MTIPGLIFTLAHRTLVSKSCGHVRGIVVFFYTHILFIMSVAFVAMAALIFLGLNGIFIPVNEDLFFMMDSTFMQLPF